MCRPPLAGRHFNMYLIKLYRQNKFWFVVVLLFAGGQLFINYKNGVMCSPFYNYDMYSNVALPKQYYPVMQISITNRLLQTKDYSPNEWDNLLQPIIFFEKQERWNRYIFQTETRKFLPVYDSSPYLKTVPQARFARWYNKQVLRIAGNVAEPVAVSVSADTFLLAQKYLPAK